MRKLAFVFLAAVGCATSTELPDAERVDGPRQVWSREPVPPGPTRPFPLPEDLDLDVLRALLPEGSLDYELSGSNACLHGTPEVETRIARISSAVARARRNPLVFTLSYYQVPFGTANTLGPIQKAAGAGTRNAFLMVPLRAGAVERIVHHGRTPVADATPSGGVRALSGRWATLGWTASTARIGGIAWIDSSKLSCDIEKEVVGVRGRIAAVPFPDGTTLVTFRIHERMPIADEILECRAFGDNTRLAVSVPSVIERRAEDTVVLGPGEELGLLGLGAQPGSFELLVLAVTPAW